MARLKRVSEIKVLKQGITETKVRLQVKRRPTPKKKKREMEDVELMPPIIELMDPSDGVII